MRNFVMHFWRTLASHKDAPALVAPGPDGAHQVTTFAEWVKQIHRLATGFMEQGLEPGDRMALIAQNSPDWLTVAAAAWAAGACLVPLVPGQPRRQTLRCLARSGTHWIVARDVEGLDEIRGQGNLPEHLQWVLLDGSRAPGGDAIHTLEALREAGRYRELRGGDKQLAERMFRLPKDQPELILFAPDPGEDPHGAFFDGERCAALLDRFGEDMLFEHGDRVAVLLSYGWFHGFLLSFAALMQGRSLVVAPTLGEVVSGLGELGPTHLLTGPAFLEGQARRWRERVEGAPELLRRMTEDGDAEGEGRSVLTRALGLFGERAAQRVLYEPIREDLGEALRAIHVVGGRLPAQVHEILGQVEIAALGIHGYPEAGVTHMERPGAPRRDAVGRPIQGVACKIEGAKAGQVGQILIRSDALTNGYWDEEGPRTIEDGWLHTGQRGWIEEGYLFLEQEGEAGEGA